MEQRMYKRGEFARLNGVTLFTLRLYDRLGLLKPAFTNKKGYHFYTDDQARALLNIGLCIKAGFSLKEIRRLQQQPNASAEDMQALLEQMRRRLHQRVVECQAGEHFVESMLYYHQSWEPQGLGKPFLLEGMSFQGFFSQPRDFSQPESSRYPAEFIRTVEGKLDHPIQFPLSYLVAEDGTEFRLFLRTVESYPQEDFHASAPHAKFAVVAFEGDLSQVPQWFSFLKASMVRPTDRILGPALLTPVQKYLFQPEGAETVYVLGLPIEQGPDPCPSPT